MSCLIPRLVATGYSLVDNMSNEECEFVVDDVYGRGESWDELLGMNWFGGLRSWLMSWLN